MTKRFALLVAGAGLLAGCFAKTAEAPGVVLDRGAGERARRGLVIVTGGTETNREAARALAAPLAAECSAEPLGIVDSADECIRVARGSAVDDLLVCRVIQYDPYDPARLVVRVTIEDVEGAWRLSGDEIVAFGRRACGRAGRAAGTREFARTFQIDLASGSWVGRYAGGLGLGDSPEDLLEAEILLRDPARFFPFAAKIIASGVPHGRAGPERAPSPRRPTASAERREAGCRALGALGELR